MIYKTTAILTNKDFEIFQRSMDELAATFGFEKLTVERKVGSCVSAMKGNTFILTYTGTKMATLANAERKLWERINKENPKTQWRGK